MLNFRRIIKISLIISCLFYFNQTVFGQEEYDLESEIYPKLKTSCCAITLAGAKCHAANTMKTYIEALKDAGVAKDDIFLKVAKKFSLDSIFDKQIRLKVEKTLIEKFGDKRPQVMIDPATFDFGQVSKGQGKVTHIFKIHNKGNSDLIINNIYSACPCTTASLKIGENKSKFFDTRGAPKDWQVILKSNKVAELEVVLDLSHESANIGHLVRKIIVLSNDPLYPSISAVVTAQVQK
ncbi:MAG: DUF1573 domain-containing protein [Candidatus Omnitrophota bacterium]